MTETDTSTPKSRNHAKAKDPNEAAEGISRSQEIRAGIVALIMGALGIVLVVILRKVDINDSATIVTLLLIPLLVYGVVSGRLKEFTGPGGWGAKFAELEKKVEKTQTQVEAQRENIGGALSGVQLALTQPPQEMKTQATTSPEAEIEALIKEYNEIRKTPAGSDRTIKMTSVVRKMIDVAPRLVQFDASQYLGSSDRGARLAAYAYLYALPNYQFLSELVDSVTNREDKPFGQYWGLQAISKNLTYQGRQTLPSEVITRLKSFAERLPPGTDRDYVLRTILREIERTND